MKPLRWLATISVLVLVSACGTPPTPVPGSTFTPAATIIVVPGATATPSLTPQPTGTLAPTALPSATRTSPPPPTAPPSPTRTVPIPTTMASLEPDWSVRNLLVGPGQPSRIYVLLRKQVPVVGPQDSRFLISDDDAKTWRPFPGGLPSCPPGNPIVAVNLDYANRDSLYVSGCDGLYHWTGERWERISSQTTLQVAVAYGRPTTIWALAGEPSAPVLRSDDGGRTWKPAATGLVHFGGMANLGFDPRDNKTLYGIIAPRYAGSYLRRAKVDGTWEEMPTPGNAVVETGMAIDGATGALYVTAYDSTRKSWQLWRSPNPNAADVKSVIWQQVHDFGPSTERVIILASLPGLQDMALYVQLPPSSCSSTAANPCLWRVLRSNDGGKTWSMVIIR